MTDLYGVRPSVGRDLSDLGSGGAPVWSETKLWRTDWTGQRLEDISRYVISASVSVDPERDMTWSLDAAVTWEGWKTLTPFRSWVAPVMTVWMPDGTAREGQLGLYLALDAEESRSEGRAVVRLDCRDALWLLGVQSLGGNVVARPGGDRMSLARSVLNDSWLGRIKGNYPWFVLPDSGLEFSEQYEWPEETNRRDVVNDILFGGGFYPLWATATGVLTTRRFGDPLRQRTPVRAWHANVPADRWDLDPLLLALRDQKVRSEIIGAVDTSPKSKDMVNEWVVVHDTPLSPAPVTGTYRLFSPGNPRIEGTGRYRTKTIYHPLVANNLTAGRIAKFLADQLSTRNTTVRFTAIADPTQAMIREVVLLGIWDERGRPVAVGRYFVHAVRWSMDPANPVMTLDVGKVDEALE